MTLVKAGRNNFLKHINDDFLLVVLRSINLQISLKCGEQIIWHIYAAVVAKYYVCHCPGRQ